MHKFGYYYLPEGKKIALQISTSTNKYRYSTNDLKKDKVTLPSADSISKLLAQTPPFDISSDRSHLELVKEFTVSKGGRKGFTVYIYECESQSLEYKELKGEGGKAANSRLPCRARGKREKFSLSLKFFFLFITTCK